MRRLLLAILVLMAGTATAQEIRKAGATSQCFTLFVSDSSSTTGAGLTGLAYNSGSLTCYYFRNETATGETATSITLNTSTLGTYASGAFKEVSAANMPGHYEFCPPDAALASGASSVMFQCKGASNMAPVNLRVTLSPNVNTDSVTTGAIEAVDFAADGVTTSESTRTIGLASGQVDADDQFAGTHGLFMYNSNGPVGYSCIIDSANTGDTVTLVADLSAVHTVGDSYIIKPDAACARYLPAAQDSGEWIQYMADGATKMCEQNISDNGTTFTASVCTTPD